MLWLIPYVFLAFVIVLVAWGVSDNYRFRRRKKQALLSGEPPPPRKRGWGSLIFTLSGMFVLTFWFGAYDFYLGHAGTLTTATIDHCRYSGKSSVCYGTWSVGGQSQTGQIVPGTGDLYPAGTRMDVRVRSGSHTAHPAGGVANVFLEISAGIAVVIVGLIVITLRGRRKNRFTHSRTG